MSTPLESLTKKIHNILPELLELTAGCQLDLHAGESFGLVTIHRKASVCKKHKKYREECSAEEDGCAISDAVFGTSGTEGDEEWWHHKIKEADLKPYQILGHPIQLPHVFRCLPDSDRNFYFEADGTFCSRNTNTGMISVLGYWNLHKGLSDQKESLIKVLDDIIL